MRATVIYIPELRRSFGSISEAARAAGADPSNVGKVLRGSRRSAGGYHFEYRWAKEKGRGEALSSLRESIEKANNLIQYGKERKRFGFSKELQDIDSIRDFVGTKFIKSNNEKIALISASSKNFVTYSVGEIQKLQQKIDQRIYLADKAIKKMDDDIKNLADMLGLSFHEALRYDNIFPEFYRMLKLAAQDKRLGTNVMLDIEIAITNAGASEAQVLDLFDRLKVFFADKSLAPDVFWSEVQKTFDDLGISSASDVFGNEDLF